MQEIKKVGNVVGGGTSQGGSVYLQDGVSPTLLNGMSHGNVMPYVVEVLKYDKETKQWRTIAEEFT